MNRTVLATAVIGAFCAFQSANAANTYNFQYQALAANQFQAVSGDFGQVMQIGDTANFDLKTAGANAFQAQSSGTMWAILGFEESAIPRTSDYTYSFLNDGAVVYSGSSLAEETSAIHMGPYVFINFTGIFDEYQWSGVLTASTASSNTTHDIMYGSDGYGKTDALFVPAEVGAVPEPASLALLGLGLAGLGFSRRRKL